MTITRETKDLPGVENVEGDVANKTATFTLDDERALDAIRQALVEIGYPAERRLG
jgi:copper chaperone CopZ